MRSSQQSIALVFAYTTLALTFCTGCATVKDDAPDAVDGQGAVSATEAENSGMKFKQPRSITGTETDEEAVLMGDQTVDDDPAISDDTLP